MGKELNSELIDELLKDIKSEQGKKFVAGQILSYAAPGTISSYRPRFNAIETQEFTELLAASFGADFPKAHHINPLINKLRKELAPHKARLNKKNGKVEHYQLKHEQIPALIKLSIKEIRKMQAPNQPAKNRDSKSNRPSLWKRAFGKSSKKGTVRQL